MAAHGVIKCISQFFVCWHIAPKPFDLFTSDLVYIFMGMIPPEFYEIFLIRFKMVAHGVIQYMIRFKMVAHGEKKTKVYLNSVSIRNCGNQAFCS